MYNTLIYRLNIIPIEVNRYLYADVESIQPDIGGSMLILYQFYIVVISIAFKRGKSLTVDITSRYGKRPIAVDGIHKVNNRKK